MPPITGINIGKDIVVSIADTSGFVTVNRVKNWNVNQKTNKRETIALDGINRYMNIPIGWEGTFEMERTSRDVDFYLARLEANYQNGKTIPPITITETITESDGQVSQFQFINCVIQLDSAGTWAGDDYVTQKISFSASFRKTLI
jgi:hypothetical protein